MFYWHTCRLVWFTGAAIASVAAATTGSSPEASELWLLLVFVLTRLAAVTTCKQEEVPFGGGSTKAELWSKIHG